MTYPPSPRVWCFASLVFAAAAVGCRPTLRLANRVDLPEARAFSDAMVAVIIEDKPADIWQNMEARFRKEVSEGQMRPSLDQVYAQFGGRPLEAEFKSEASGQKVYSDGTTKPLRRFWYAVGTTTQAMGNFFLIVEVVPDGAGLACAGFSIVSFPGGPPSWLR